MIHYDPPSGWMYGFPKVYAPREGEAVAETLVRDGYPVKEAAWAAKYTRFMGSAAELSATVETRWPEGSEL